MEATKSRSIRRAAGILAALISLLVLAVSASPSSTMPPQQKSPFLLGAYFNARKIQDAAEQAISRLEAEIRKNLDVASKSRKLMELADQRNDDKAKRAKQTAAQALRLAEESLAWNKKRLIEWRTRKSCAEKSMSELMRMLKEPAGQRNVLSQVSSLGGRAQILKPDGSSLNLEGDSPGFLTPGDIIKTSDGMVELQALGGRATTRLAPESELAVMDETEGEQNLELVRGRLHGAVDKVGSYLTRLKQGFEDYRNDLSTIKDLFTDDELKNYL